MSSRTSSNRVFWTIVLSTFSIMAITMGIRQSMGLFVSPLNTATGLGIVTISFAMAVGQFAWGAAQPLFGMLADRVGSRAVVALGAVMIAVGLAATPFVQSGAMLVFVFGVVAAVGAGGGSFSILMGATARQLPPERRAFASGIINAGGSFGQFLFAPVSQALIAGFGWVVAMLTLAVTSLATIPLAKPLGGRETIPAKAGSIGIGRQLGIAFANPSYGLLHAGFFTCGFHVAFLLTHLPGEVALCGLPEEVSAAAIAIIGAMNIVGSITVGWMGQRYRMKYLLFWLYAARAAAVGLYLLSPKVPLTFYAFSAVIGLTWLATVPPTAGLVGKLFGVRYLATLFGLVLLSHQIGGFFGAWLGGVAVDATGSYAWMWYGDMALAAAAALVNLPIRESRPGAAQPVPA